jgi:hypothetical protein
MKVTESESDKNIESLRNAMLAESWNGQYAMIDDGLILTEWGKSLIA